MTEGSASKERIPGTYVFTGPMSSEGYRLNKFFFSLTRPEHREAFKADLDRFDLTDWEKLSPEVKLVHQNYYAPMLTGMGLLLLEDTLTPA